MNQKILTSYKKITLLFLVLGIACAARSGAQAASDAKIILFQDGGQTEITSTSPDYKNILAQCESFFVGATDIPRFIVTPQIIEDIKKSRAIEIIYPAPKKLTITHNHMTKEITRLLIPLSGDLTGKATYIFYADPEYREFNVVISLGSLDLFLKQPGK